MVGHAVGLLAPNSVQVLPGIKDPAPLVIKVTVPSGALVVPPAVSATLTVQLTELLTTVLVGVQEIVVLVDLNTTKAEKVAGVGASAGATPPK